MDDFRTMQETLLESSTLGVDVTVSGDERAFCGAMHARIRTGPRARWSASELRAYFARDSPPAAVTPYVWGIGGAGRGRYCNVRRCRSHDLSTASPCPLGRMEEGAH
jgi:hypothetical protein